MSFLVLLMSLIGFGVNSQPGNQTYRVVFVPGAQIELDGKADESVWKRAFVERRFQFAGQTTPPPLTEFRAICTEDALCFHFNVEDADVVVLPTLRDEEDQVFQDRVEMYFALDDQLKEYYCFEIDSKGRAFDYKASYYRQLDTNWKWKQLETKGTPTPKGYAVEGRIPLASLEALGFPRLRPGVRIRTGVYRAEFSHDRSGRPVERKTTIHNRGRFLDGPPPIESWITWVDPKTPEPDFHVPSSLGWFEIIK